MKILKCYTFFVVLNLIGIYTAFADDEFPETRTYVPFKDSGFSKYAALSLRGSKKIVLTFDDGPSPVITPLVLDILKKYQVKATFFLMGQNINSVTYPIIERALREGHLIGAHSMHHAQSNGLSEDQFKTDTKETFKRIQEVMDRSGIVQNEVYYRFPYGAYGRSHSYHHFNVLKEISQEIYGDNCINFVFWSTDSSDWVKGMTGDEVFENVMASFDGGMITDFAKVNGRFEKYRRKALPEEVTQGGVVLFHDVHTPSLDALPHLLDTFQKRQIKVVLMNTVKEYSFDHKVCGANTEKHY